MKHSQLHCGSCLCTLSASNIISCMQTLLPSSYIHPSFMFDLCEKSFFFFNSCLCSICQLASHKCYMAPLSQLLAQYMCHPSMSLCTDEWHPTASTLCPISLPRKNTQEVSCSYAQKWTSKESFLKIFLTIRGYFKHKTYHIRLAEERNLENVGTVGWKCWQTTAWRTHFTTLCYISDNL